MIGAACSGVTNRGVPSTKMKPRASAPASTATLASSRFVIPQTLTLTIERELPELRPDVDGADEPLADEHGVGARVDHAPDLVAGEEPALAHDDRPRRGGRAGARAGGSRRSAAPRRRRPRATPRAGTRRG